MREENQADSVSILVMNPQNGEILAMVNEPEFNLNEPFALNTEIDTELSEEEKQNALNKMWRNQCINDTYEPGSTFKIITASAALEEGKVSLSDQFNCPGYKIVEDRRIRCRLSMQPVYRKYSHTAPCGMQTMIVCSSVSMVISIIV